MFRIISFDTSAPEVQVALLQDGNLAYEHSLGPADKNRQESASMLLPLIDNAIKSSSWKKTDIDLIVVGVGPGSFTGVRVAVITARSIGQALNLGIYPVSTLELAAMNAARPCAVALNAGAGKIYGAAYGEDIFASVGSEIVQPFCGLPGDISAKLEESEYTKSINWIVEDGLDKDSFTISTSSSVSPPASNRNRAADAALLASKRLSNQTRRAELAITFPWHKVLPLYLRSPSVTLKKVTSPNSTAH